jgi:hypothetical protein
MKDDRFLIDDLMLMECCKRFSWQLLSECVLESQEFVEDARKAHPSKKITINMLSANILMRLMANIFTKEQAAVSVGAMGEGDEFFMEAYDMLKKNTKALKKTEETALNAMKFLKPPDRFL